MATAQQSTTGSTPGDHPPRRIDLEACARRVRVELGGRIVADSARTVLLREENHPPVHYFPRDDVWMELLTRTDHVTHCPYKGDASYWTAQAGDRTAQNAVWSYERPIPAMAAIAGCLAFYRDRMDGWSEEDLPDEGGGRPAP